VLVFMFALLTGLAPAVSRATLMITLHTLSRLAGRRTSGINILAGAAFLMLMARPEWLFSIGFLLSFLAVAGIMCLYTPAMAMINMNYGRWRKALAGLAMVSLVAQAGTAPLCLYSFHAFPIYFLPANLLTVPLSTIAIYTGMVALPLELAGIPNHMAVQAFSLLLTAMHKLSAWFASLPGAYGEFIPFSTHALIFSYALLLILVISFSQRVREMRLTLALMVLLLWGGTEVISNYRKATRTEVWLLSGKGIVLAEVEGRKARVWNPVGVADSLDASKLKSWALDLGIPLRAISYNRLKMSIPTDDGSPVNDTMLWCTADKRLFLWVHDPTTLDFPEILMPGLVLITGKHGIRTLKNWDEDLRPAILVLDGSVRFLDEKKADALMGRTARLWISSRQGSLKLE
ncbi:MAG: ComEC/Rec2 family competence protein, partial [Bacteroidales bacterium]|nr:ComEC/Rec2 family competence protein [Bacteroidales bacterium]